ncbi:copper chaperone PCu(A)C [Neisseria sp. Ec49-e6-T10]|uniref:copper chaperone PCu(A)C n=1 Tax=Neisseria sp. Ec49-e6-T10 TaxID=3140744 RepID=UPI003EBF15AC
MRNIHQLIKLLCFICLLNSSVAFAKRIPNIVINQAWSRVTAPSVKTGAVFMDIKVNHTDDVLIGAQTNRAKKVELHTHIDDNGVMRMREVKGGIPLVHGTTTSLKPGGLHIMLFDVTSPLKLGDTFEVTLKFKNTPDQTITVLVDNGQQTSHMNH